MTDQRPRYKWPRYVLAGVILFLAATIVFMIIEVRIVHNERDFSAPVQTK